MNSTEATQHALGYAAGREDASGIKTAEPTVTPGFLAFAQAYAAAWEEYNTEKRGFMVCCQAAYDSWQETRGETIFNRR